LILLQVLHPLQFQANAIGSQKPFGPEPLEEGRPSTGPTQKAAGKSGKAQDARVNGCRKNEE
jgi:hypothetical protein